MRGFSSGCLVGLGLMGCPPPEVLYGPEIFDQQSAAVDAPALPGVPTVARNPALQQARLRNAQASNVGPTTEAVRAGPHVTFAGTVVCKGCVEQLVVHVVALGPTGEGPPPGTLAGGSGRTPLVSAVVAKGPFSIPVPNTTLPVTVELLVDTNADGVPSVGERYARWLDPKSPLRADQDQTGLVLDVSDRPQGTEARARAEEAAAATRSE